eukprot:Phypoly_transcript_02118.p1 GENE.Phypoly_transcript_02118~~Phypoly_transcript_02118.p1  ORF type:complete len:472 (+),score=87.24 Phypoly_transcript_02118:1490-2905(+)
MEELLDLNVDDDEEIQKGNNETVEVIMEDNDNTVLDASGNSIQETSTTFEEGNNKEISNVEEINNTEDTNNNTEEINNMIQAPSDSNLKRGGDDIVGQPTKKQHVIDLTEHDTESGRGNFNAGSSAFGCNGCSSFFVSRVAQKKKKKKKKNMGNKKHTLKLPTNGPANQEREIIDLSKTVSKWKSNQKAARIPNSVVIKRPTLDTINSKTFAESIVKDAGETVESVSSTNHPQTYIPLVPVSNKKLVPIHPEPGMMTIILNSVKCAVLFDLDNMAKWCNLRKPSKDIFVWGFCGDAIPGLPLWTCKHFDALAEKQRLWITKCGRGANSADFGMAYHAAQLGFLLPITVPILIISGDRDLFHTMGHLLSSGRRTFMYDKREKLYYIDDMIAHAFKEMKVHTTGTTTPTAFTLPTPSTPSTKSAISSSYKPPSAAIHPTPIPKPNTPSASSISISSFPKNPPISSSSGVIVIE